MNLNLTATVNLQRASIKDANSARMHNQHSPEVKHENVQIDPSMTKFNLHKKFCDREEVLHAHYDEMINHHNVNNRNRYLAGKIGKEEFKANQWDLNKYLSNIGKKPKQPLTTFVATIGNLDSEFQLLDALGFDYKRVEVKGADGKKHEKPVITNSTQQQQFIKLMRETYFTFAEAINKHLRGIKITEAWIHFDEGGTPHLQGEIVNLGHSSKGKPSYNLNQALRETLASISRQIDDVTKTYVSHSKDKTGKEHVSPNGKLLMKQFRQNFDKTMINSFNLALKSQGFGKKVQAGLVRTGNRGGLSMKDYQKHQAMMREQQDAMNALKGAYSELTGDSGGDGASPLEMAKKLKKAVTDIKKQADDSLTRKSAFDKQIKSFNDAIGKESRRYLQLQQDIKDAEAEKDQTAKQLKSAIALMQDTKESLKGMQDKVRKVQDELAKQRLKRRQLVLKEAQEAGIQNDGKPLSISMIIDKNVDNISKQAADVRKKQLNNYRLQKQQLSRLDDANQEAKRNGFADFNDAAQHISFYMSTINDMDKIIQKYATANSINQAIRTGFNLVGDEIKRKTHHVKEWLSAKFRNHESKFADMAYRVAKTAYDQTHDVKIDQLAKSEAQQQHMADKVAKTVNSKAKGKDLYEIAKNSAESTYTGTSKTKNPNWDR